MIELTPARIEILKAWAKDLLTTYQPDDFKADEVEFIEEILRHEAQ